ncbi:MAG: thioredoxin [Candidatus Aenigmarchaeota archaeon]|nr:thioredoxin [Candidatus Aenigmarchaeota archaeon]
MNESEEIKKSETEKLKKNPENHNIKVKIEVNENDFEEKVLKQSEEVPVVVDFWAEWCMPCLMLGPALEKIAEEYGGKFILAKLDVNENPRISQKYGIMSIPAVKMFKNGKVADEFVGALPESQVKEWIAKNLSA